MRARCEYEPCSEVIEDPKPGQRTMTAIEEAAA